VTVDEAYVRRSITDPGADQVAAHGPGSPTPSSEDTEAGLLVEWVRSLG